VLREEKSVFVVIYDFRNSEGNEEELYYGYFDTPEQAERLYRDIIRGHESHYTNARICQVVKAL
jgi:hypothetical protein